MQFFSLRPISDLSVRGISIVTKEEGYITPWEDRYWDSVGLKDELAWYLSGLAIYTYVSKDNFFNSETNTIFLSSFGFKRSTLVHEVQHAIQFKDERLIAFNGKIFNGKFGWDYYISHPSEIESRWASDEDYITDVNPLITEAILKNFNKKE